MVLAVNNAATYDSGFAKTEVLSELIKTAQVYAPLLSDHMTSVPSTASRIEWGDQALNKNLVTLASAYTAGTGTMTISASTLTDPYVLIPGITELATLGGSAYFPVTGFNPTTGVVTIGTPIGTDASIASGVSLFVSRATASGENAGAHNDVQFASFDYNYLSNFSYTIKIGNMNQKGQLDYYLNEVTFENQLQNNVPAALATMEFRAWKDIRTAGSGAASRNGNTIQSGNNSRAGGVLGLAASRGLYTATTAAPFSEDLIDTDIGTLDDRGAFNGPFDKTRDMGTKMCRVYCHPSMIGTFNKYTRLQRSREAFMGANDKVGGMTGSYAYRHMTGRGIELELVPSTGLAQGELVYVPRKDLIEVRVVRMLEEQPEIYGGDNSTKLYSCTFTTVVQSPYLLGYRTNVTA